MLVRFRKNRTFGDSSSKVYRMLLFDLQICKYLQVCGYTLFMPDSKAHAEHGGAGPLSEEEARTIAEVIGALSNPSRVTLLYALREGGESPVGELAERAGVTPSAASQQLRILRHLRLVVAKRSGRSVHYSLHDHHVAALLDEVRNHAEHALRGWSNAERIEEGSP